MPKVEKLIRDEIPKRIFKDAPLSVWLNGNGAERVRQYSEEEFRTAVLNKILEEAQELIEAAQNGDREEMLQEVADVYTILGVFCQLHRLSDTEVKKAQANKHAKNGGFEKRYCLETQITERP